MSDETTTQSATQTTDTNTTNGVDARMAQYASEVPERPEVGDIVEGPVFAVEPSAVYIDLHPQGTGVIYGREFINARDVLRKVSIGDTIAAKVVEQENKYGHIELSLKEARQALIWSEAEEAIKHKTVFDLPIKEANKGGLIIEWQGIQGFLPASQLSNEHYPRVEDGNKEQILAELQKLVGQKLHVSIIAADPQEGKLIFSEKEMAHAEKGQIVEKYSVGDEVSGEVTGVVDFGVFVKLEEGLEGLVHISEIDWGLVEDPRQLYSEGDTVTVRIIEIKEGKVSLSIKALKENPWVSAAERYQTGDTVNAVVIKHNKHGALASIEEGVAGLVHVSEFASTEELQQTLELGKTYPFVITYFDPQQQRMTLSYTKANSGEAQTGTEHT